VFVRQLIFPAMGACASGADSATEAPQNDPTMLLEYSGSGPWYVCEPDAKVNIQFARAGLASAEVCPPKTIITVMQACATKHPDKEALKVERPCPDIVDGKPPPALPEAEWLTWTYKEYVDEVRIAAKAFIKLGFAPHDSVNVWGFNSPEWLIAANAGIFAGGKIAGLYPTDMDETAAYKVAHSGGSIIVIEEQGKLKKLQEGLRVNGKSKRVKAIIAYGYEPAPGQTVDIVNCGQVPVLSWKAMLAIGQGEPDTALESRISKVDPGHCAALIYTSGTTGEPKAVMISHDNIIFESSGLVEMLGNTVGFGRCSDQERILSYLPLSHVAGMMVDIISPIVCTHQSSSWVTLYFARNYDLKVGAIKDRLQIARPTIFLGVPLVWEKIADKIRAIGAANTGLKKTMGDWAKKKALENSKSKQLGGELKEPMGLSVSLSLLGKVKESLGLQECKFGMTGAAPIRVDTLEYFGSLGLPINEVYGMSECTGAATISSPQVHQWGSCGYELSGVEVKAFVCDPTDLNKKTVCPRAPSLEDTSEEYQGELCYRGRNIMMGYMYQPDFGAEHVAEIKKKTGEAIDNDGWLHSGDKGMISEHGMVKITGRYKELIIGEGGENIAPVPIEDHVKKQCDGIADIMMLGDKRKYNVALITLKAEGANGEVPGTDNLDAGATRVNPDVKTISQAMKDKQWIDTVTAAITSANNNAKVCANNAAKIQKFTILPHNFSEQGNELTPTKKLKRGVVLKTYSAAIEHMYSTSGTYIEFVC